MEEFDLRCNYLWGVHRNEHLSIILLNGYIEMNNVNFDNCLNDLDPINAFTNAMIAIDDFIIKLCTEHWSVNK